MPSALEDLRSPDPRPVDYFRGLDKTVSVGRVAPRLEASTNRAGGLEVGRPQQFTTANTLDALLGELAAQQALDAKYGTWPDLLSAPESAPIVPGQRSLALGGRATAGGPRYTHGVGPYGVIQEIPAAPERRAEALAGVEGLTKSPGGAFPPMIKRGSALDRILRGSARSLRMPSESLTYPTVPQEALPPAVIEAITQGQYRGGVQQRQDLAEARRQLSEVEKWLDDQYMDPEKKQAYLEQARRELGLSGPINATSP